MYLIKKCKKRKGFKTVENIYYGLQIVFICTVYKSADIKYDEICVGSS